MQRAMKCLLWAAILGLVLPHVGFAQISNPQLEDFAEVLVRTKSPQERGVLLAAKKELQTAELRKELIRQGNMLLMAGKYSDAFDVYTFTKSVAEQIGDKEGIASASLDIGTVYFFQGNYALALEHYQKARDLFVEVGNKTDAAKALSGLALIQKEQHQNTEALKNFGQALQEFEVLKDREEMANTLGSIGAIYYAAADYAAAAKAFLRSTELNDNSDNLIRIADAFYMQRDYKQAADYYQRSLQSVAGDKSAAGLVGALGGAANSNYYLGNYDAALDYYRRNMTVQEKLGDESGVAISLQGMGNVYRARGDFGAALESYLKSLDVADHSHVTVSLATTLGSIGLVRALQGDNTQAKDYYGKSLAQFESAGDKVGMARMLSQLGNVYYAEGAYDTALESYRKSLALRQAMADKSGEANIQGGIGTVYLAQKNYALALESYQTALGIYESTANNEGVAETLTRIANACFLQGDYTQTLKLSERAAVLARQTDSLNTLWYARLLSGKAERALGQSALASQAFSEAITILESLRSLPATTEPGGGRGSLLPYLAQMELLIEQNKIGEAFEVMERAKVQALSDLLSRSNAKITHGMSAAEQTEERKLTGEVVSLELQLDRDTQSRSFDQARRVTLTGHLREARLALESFRKTLFAKHPQLKINRGEPAALKLDESATLIADRQTAVLEYTVAEDNVYLFVLTAEQPARSTASKAGTKPDAAAVSLKIYPLNLSRKDLTERVWHLYQLLASHDEAFHQPARELYDLLIKPAEAQLAARSKLIIVPDGILWRLPFEALQPAEDRYLIDQMSASYVPSLSALRGMRKQAPGATPASAARLSAFGNPLLAKELLQRIDVTYNWKALAPSPEQAAEEEREIMKLQAVYGEGQSRIFSAAGASEERARIEAGRADVLHFATRAILDDASPMYSFIALSPAAPPEGPGGPGGPGKLGRHEDGLLLSGEIMNLHSTARLVVMSGSSMKRERVGSGDAAVALLWSWFLAGSPAAVISRWEVDSPGVTQLMSEFHTRLRSRARLKRSDSKADALCQSALQLRHSRDYQHPYYWSGFALLGDGR